MSLFGNVSIGGETLQVLDFGIYIFNSSNRQECNKRLPLRFSILAGIDQSRVLNDMRLAAMDSKHVYIRMGPVYSPNLNNEYNLDGSPIILVGFGLILLHESVKLLLEINSMVSSSVFHRIKWKSDGTNFMIVEFTIKDDLLEVSEVNIYHHLDGLQNTFSKEILMINYNDNNHFRGIKPKNIPITVRSLRPMLQNLYRSGCLIHHSTCNVSNLPVLQSYNYRSNAKPPTSDFQSFESI